MQTGAGPCAEETRHPHLRAGFPGRLGRQADQLRLGLDEHARGPLGRAGRDGLGDLRSSLGEGVAQGRGPLLPHAAGDGVRARRHAHQLPALHRRGEHEFLRLDRAGQQRPGGGHVHVAGAPEIRPLLHAIDEARRSPLGHSRAHERGRYAARQLALAGDPGAVLQAERPRARRPAHAALERRRSRPGGRHGHPRRPRDRHVHRAPPAEDGAAGQSRLRRVLRTGNSAPPKNPTWHWSAAIS